MHQRFLPLSTSVPHFPDPPFTMMNTLNVLLIDDTNNTLLEDCLNKDGFRVMRTPYSNLFLPQVTESKPDVLIFQFGGFPKQLLDGLKDLNQQAPLPVIVITADAPDDTIGQAINAGVNTFIADGFDGRRVTGIIHATIARFRQLQALKNALEEARAQLEDRKQIDRAKAILIKTRNFTENEAYHTLRKLAMDRNITLGEMAKNVIAMAELLK